jgi:hypothetical protein
MPSEDILSALGGGDRRSTGRADEVAALVADEPRLFPKLMAGLWSTDPLIRMRAADAVEKVTRTRCELLRPYKKELLGLAAEASQQEVRWHLAAMLPRLALTGCERQAAIFSLRSYLDDHSSIVKTFALQGLAELAEQEPRVQPEVVELLRQAERNGTPAMRARSRKLLKRFEQP